MRGEKEECRGGEREREKMQSTAETRDKKVFDNSETQKLSTKKTVRGTTFAHGESMERR